MFFTVNNIYNKPIEILKITAKTQAYTRLLLYPMGATEIRLNQYLYEHRKKDLLSLCIELLFAAKFSTSDNNTLTVYWPTKEQENLVTLITYGNLDVPGSTILQTVFTNL